MTHLIFCSYEVGGFPFQMADVLNRHGIRTLYASVARDARGHDSMRYHHGGAPREWDVSSRFAAARSHGAMRRALGELRRDRAATGDGNGFAGCLATGDLSYLLAQAGIPYYYWTYGSDMDQNCFAPVRRPEWSALRYAMVSAGFRFRTRARQRRSYRFAERIMIAPHLEAMAREVAPGARLFFLPHFLRLRGFEELRAEKAARKRELAERFGGRRFLFSATRHEWAGLLRNHFDNKGNDILLKAFARYAHDANDADTRLLLVEKGNDVEASRRLVAELGLEPLVRWLAPMPRRELDALYLGADLCLAQFHTPVFSFAVLEPLACATPCVSHIGRPGDIPVYASSPPVFDATDPERIAAHIRTVLDAPDEELRLSRAGWEWIAANCSEERFARQFVRVFEEDNPPVLR
jgi:glycosyltransferase involved in cell wall biosynthesis